MHAIRSCSIEPIREQFDAPLPDREEVHHPLGCHRPRIPDRIALEELVEVLVEVLVFGRAYWRIADESCSGTAPRRRRDEWIDLGVMERSREMAPAAYDRTIGLELADVAVDGCITKAPCGGEKAGGSPVDRGKQGVKRSTAVDARGIPLGTVTAPANRHDSPLLAETLDAMAQALGGVPERASVHPDRSGYDSFVARERLEDRGLIGEISEKGKPAPLGATNRWVVERTKKMGGGAHQEDGWWSAPTRGATPTRGLPGARSVRGG